MRVGLFTDTYFPQVSGVATSIRTLKTELEKLGHTVFIFTTTDKDVNRYEDWQIIRIPSVPFFAFKDRRVAYRGFSKALAIAKQYQLDIIHTQTEFSLGLLGVWIGRELRITLVAWPSIYLVVECVTISAPHSNGRQLIGVANVLSTIRGTP